MTRPILVFGARGQLGKEISAQAAEQNIDVAAASRADADILDPASVSNLIERSGPRLIVNCAAYTAVDQAEREPELAAAVNITGAAVVAREAANAKIPIIHLSTDYVFDGEKRGAYVESDAIAPLNVYGRTKAEGEEKVRTAAPCHVILRTAWVYGRFGHNFVKSILRLSRERLELRIVGDQRGCPTSTQDLAAAIFSIDKRLGENGFASWGTFHFAGTGVTSWYGFARQIIATQAEGRGHLPRIFEIVSADYPTPARRPMNSELNSDRFFEVFGYRAAPWRERVAETVSALIE